MWLECRWINMSFTEGIVPCKVRFSSKHEGRKEKKPKIDGIRGFRCGGDLQCSNAIEESTTDTKITSCPVMTLNLEVSGPTENGQARTYNRNKLELEGPNLKACVSCSFRRWDFDVCKEGTSHGFSKY